MKTDQPEVLYILGHPYTGSTLFSVALGNSPDIVNLGEVSTLENDYGDRVRCLCGDFLSECSFWQRVKRLLDQEQSGCSHENCFRLSADGELTAPDSRNKSTLMRLKLSLGVNVALSTAQMEAYAQKNEHFFNAVNKAMVGQILVDASKSPYRLDLLSQQVGISLRVIWLRRQMKELFKSRIKRMKRRSQSYNPIFSTLFHLTWLLAYYFASRRIYNRIPDEHKCVVWYEEFVNNGAAVQDTLTRFLERDIDFHIDASNCMQICDQHVYVGNRWLFDPPGQTSVEIKRSGSTGELSRVEETIYQAFSLAFHVLKE